MKYIEIIQTGYDIRCLFSEAKTVATRDLLGYMIQTGRTDNLVLGGAFRLLKELEALPAAETYQLTGEDGAAKEIVAVAEAARAGAFHRFTLSPRELRKINKNLQLIMG